MKKGIRMLFVFALCLGITGCDKGASAEDTQEKIEKAGWDISMIRDKGTATDDLSLEINKEESFRISRVINDDEISYLLYLDTSNTDGGYGISYAFEDDVDKLIVLLASGDACTYDLTNEAATEIEIFDKECEASIIEEGKNKKDKRDELLDKVDIRITDLETWAKWYYENK